MKSVISVTDRSLEKPAAMRWPPPPLFRAIAETLQIFGGRPEADPSRRAVGRRRLADEGGELGALDAAQVVDDSLGERLLRAGVGEVAALEVGDDEPAALVDLRPLERARDELELREGDVFVDVLEDAMEVRARFDELRGQAERLLGRVRVLEPAGVGDERDEQRLCDAQRERRLRGRRKRSR